MENSNNLKTIRKKRNLRQADVARLLNTDQSTISRLEGGAVHLDAFWIEKFAALYQCLPSDIQADTANPDGTPLQEELFSVPSPEYDRAMAAFYIADTYVKSLQHKVSAVDVYRFTNFIQSALNCIPEGESLSAPQIKSLAIKAGIITSA